MVDPGFGAPSYDDWYGNDVADKLAVEGRTKGIVIRGFRGLCYCSYWVQCDSCPGGCSGVGDYSGLPGCFLAVLWCGIPKIPKSPSSQEFSVFFNTFSLMTFFLTTELLF